MDEYPHDLHQEHSDMYSQGQSRLLPQTSYYVDLESAWEPPSPRCLRVLFVFLASLLRLLSHADCVESSHQRTKDDQSLLR